MDKEHLYTKRMEFKAVFELKMKLFNMLIN